MMRERVMNSKMLFVFLMTISLIIQGCENKKKTTDDELQTLSVRLPIPVVEAGQTPFYVAIDKGYYAAEGLDVKFHLASKELNPIKMVESSQDHIGIIGGIDTLVIARSKGYLLKAFAVLHKDSNFPCLITLKSSGITKLEQLQNKKIGFFYGHISTDVLRYLLKKNHINYQEVDVGFNYSQLIAKQIDAEWAFRVTAGLELPYKGIEINIISPKDYNITTHGYTLFAKNEYISKHPALIQKFMKATAKGIKFTLQNPHEALKSLLKRNKNLKQDLSLKRLKEYNKVTSSNPVGYMDFTMFNETYQRLKESGLIQSEFNIHDLYTKSFLSND